MTSRESEISMNTKIRERSCFNVLTLQELHVGLKSFAEEKEFKEEKKEMCCILS